VDSNLKRSALASLAVVVVALAAYFSYARTGAPKGAELRVATSARYGSVLVVDGGVLGGFPLYEFSGDAPGHLGCGTTKEPGYDLDPDARVSLSCTGPMGNINSGVTSDDWPAFTTTAAPVAGPGVNQKLLGTIARKGIGDQVTYAGHPLYLFDPSSAPFDPLGVDYVETVSPLAPWHGYWFLVSAFDGDPVGVATIESASTPDGERVLAVEGDPNIDPFALATYTYSRDPRDESTCTGPCARIWVPLVTITAPKVEPGVRRGEIRTIRLPDGCLQVTYEGHPLYLYANERVFLHPQGGIEPTGTAGNGNGVRGPRGGTFSTVALAST
jgi:predicted lipoprotein with Yx(FWY)xxD motif